VNQDVGTGKQRQVRAPSPKNKSLILNPQFKKLFLEERKMSSYRVKISIPERFDKILIAPLLLVRRIWYGYSFRRIPLINSKKYAIVDAEDYYALSKYIWWTRKRKGSYQVLRFTEECACFHPVFMHRDVMRLKLCAESCLSRGSEAKADLSRRSAAKTDTVPAGLVIDHIDRDPLNNTRANLRLATIAQNNMNKSCRGGRSKYKGIVYRARKKLWLARITVNGKCKYIKSCKSEIDAAKAYDKAAKKYFGEFAYLNFPPPKKLKGLKPRIRLLFTSVFVKTSPDKSPRQVSPVFAKRQLRRGRPVFAKRQLRRGRPVFAKRQLRRGRQIITDLFTI
jgi:hypothetical protein